MKSCFIFKGKRYNTKNSELLCKFDMEEIGKKILYVSPKGAFFTVEDTIIDGTKFSLIDKAEAINFINEHPEGLKENAYVKIFGEPEEG